MAEPAALAAAAETALAAAEAALAAERTAAIDDATVQRLLAAGIRLFARKTEEERRHFPPVPGPEAVTPTEAAVLAVELLRTVNINLFDLSMWAARPRYDE
ncbi:MAG: hypothetical protein K2X74_20735 [Acetobacteraceae bacterium]|nr:hypothetical protein [Acetobacteraceae bacterium]